MLDVARAFRIYISTPFRLLSTSIYLFILVLLAIALDKISNYFSSKPVFTAQWFFHVLPSQLALVVHSSRAVAAIVVLYLIKSLVIYVIIAEVVRLYRGAGSRFGASCSVRGLLWFLKAEVFIYMFFGVIAVGTYTGTRALWLFDGWNTLYLLLIVFVLAYPAFYSLVSIAAFLGSLPIKASKMDSLFFYVFRRDRFRRLYMFFFIRAVAELFIGVVFPVLALLMIPNSTGAIMVAALLMAMPLLLFHGSAMAFKLEIYSDDSCISSLFGDYFAANNRVCRVVNAESKVEHRNI